MKHQPFFIRKKKQKINESYRIYETRVFIAGHRHDLTIGFIRIIENGHLASKTIDINLNIK
ncbi:MAG TPA: hypothetical protein ENG70_03925 [Candidatus Cloacimonetes bacterium]|nr:hypothetical protein [Candidatus Cloacimonadota bacterium]HEX37991.1 hypothetical protein [Candidatus Cloacimonadota bacterium]